MTTPPDRRATITEGDRETAHAFVESIDRHHCDDDLHDWVCTGLAQALADTREAADARASIPVRALEEVERWAKQVSISYPGIIASRALAEYAEAGKGTT
jgi:hypothetical protein